MAIEDYTKFIQLGLPFNRALPQDMLTTAVVSLIAAWASTIKRMLI